jgi:hypothetical protein
LDLPAVFDSQMTTETNITTATCGCGKGLSWRELHARAKTYGGLADVERRAHVAARASGSATLSRRITASVPLHVLCAFLDAFGIGTSVAAPTTEAPIPDSGVVPTVASPTLEKAPARSRSRRAPPTGSRAVP